MELAVSALGSLLPKLGTLLSDEYKLQKGVRGEIKFLQAEMESMQAVLTTLSERPADQITKLDKIWVRDLKELSYDIEDSVDTFMVRIDSQASAKPDSFTRFFERTIGLLTKAKTRHRVANDIEDIKRRISEVAARRERYNKLERVAAQPDTTVDQRRAMACFEHAANLVGTDVPVQKISNLLTNENGLREQKRMVVSIVGVGGLGKTTIANLVYKRFGGQFDCQSFVSVSLRPNMTQILSKILRQVSNTHTAGEADDLDELIRKIRKVLEDKRYFIVIDDVWSEEAWKTIEGALIDNNLGSRIILTTRNVEVARSSSFDGPVYQLDPLSDKDSEKLLSIRIFNEGEGIPSNLEEVAKNILKKCGGVPLAIITIASMLASIPNKTKYEWFRVYKSMGRGLQKDNKSLESMREILHLSYGDLPPYLKPCLLYLSVFPEDYEIRRWDLIWMWVGEGFIDGEQQSNLYDLGERYFRELVNRSMIQPVGVDVSGTPSACRVHDMILDLIITLSAQENFVTISGGPHDISSAGKIRRLSLQGKKVDTNEEDNKKEKVVLSTTATSHVRTLITFGDAFQWIPPLSSFPLLRVLLLKKSNNNTLQGLGSLHHLRYLELSGGVETEHLEEIGNLKHLKTLDMWGTRIKELPASIVQLRQLECLITNEGVKFPDGMGNLVSLQQLSNLDVRKSSQTLVELGLLTGLRELVITGINRSCVKTFLQSLNNLHNIHTLLLCKIETWCSLDCIPDQWSGPARLQEFRGYGILMVPRWFSSLSELSCLYIGVHILRQDDLQLLGALPVLRSLKIFVYDRGTTDGDLQGLVIGTDQPFRSLTFFKFLPHRARCLLVFAEGVMPKLETLELSVKVRPIGGGAFHGGLENLTSLKQMEVIVDCEDATIMEVQEVETKVKDTIDKLLNHPTLNISRERLQRESDSEASEQQRSDLQDIEDECHKGSEASEKSLTMD